MAVAPSTHGQQGQIDTTDSEYKLTISDHFLICQFLKNVSKEDVQRLGGALGLSYPALQKMNSFPGEMVAAWLNRQDKVLQHSGEPTWSTLEDALRKIGQTGLAEDLKTKRIVHDHTSHNSSGNHARKRNTSESVKSEALLSEETGEDLYQRIITDMRKMKLKFSTVQDQIWKSIGDIQGLVRLVLGMSMLSEEDEEQIKKFPSDAPMILTKYWSFLDFENLEHIVENQCSSTEKDMMKAYKEEVLKFCQRRVSEFPPNCLGSSGNNAGMKKLYVTLDLDDPALKHIKHLKIIIANILGCRASELVLQNVEYGCVLVTFLLATAVGRRLVLDGRILTTEQKSILKKEHVISLKYESTILFNAREIQHAVQHQMEQCTVSTSVQKEGGTPGKPSVMLQGLKRPMMTSFYGEKERRKALQLKKLEQIILRSVFNGHFDPTNKAIKLLSAHFGESVPHDGRQLLDFFPSRDWGMFIPDKYLCHSPLMIACEENKEDIVELLIENRASVALKNKNGLTAVHIACKNGRRAIMSSLLEKAKTQKHFCFTRSLASDYDVVISAKAREGWTPLMYTVKGGHLEIVKECFTEEHFHCKTKKKQTVLHIAAKWQRFECLKELLLRPTITRELKLAVDKKGWNILHHACAGGSKEILQWLVETVPELQSQEIINHKTNSGYTPLLIACEYQKEEAVEYLLTLSDVDVSACAESVAAVDDGDDDTGPDGSGEGAQGGKSALHIAAIHDSAKIAEMLIKGGCPLCVQDLEGNTALHVAYRKSSHDVIDLLLKSPEGKTLEKMRNYDTDPKLPHTVKREDVIPPEITKKGKAAVEIYRRALRKGKQKIPRCNLLILGEERTGKTSLYRLLVGKGFNPDQDSTRGIDNTVVETVDVRHVASDTWEEKTMDDQKRQSKSLFAVGVVKEVKKEVQFVKKEDSMENFLCSSKKLMDAIQNIERILNDIMKHESHRQHRSNFSQQSHQQTPHTGLREVQPPAPIVHSKSTPQSYTSSSSQHSLNQDAGSKILKDTGLRRTSDIHVDQNPVEQETALDTTITTTKPEKVRFANELPALNSTKQTVPKPTGQLTVVQVSRSHSKEMSKLIKSEGQEHKELALTYNTLDFAGQKEYHPMHHCFITRRAIYLVVFNLQKMIKYITKKEQNAENPLEQIRYWLHSIHAHVFPPKEDDHMRRVCIVGTHRSPKQSKDGEEITEGRLQHINNELRTLERDERCVSHLHYTSNPERMFIAVENSMDKKGERELSGALQLQRELKEVSNNLKFLEEDHPVIWLNFEAQLVEYCNVRKSKGKSVVVPVQDVLAIASRNGIETEDDQCLALDFFHDTGKIIYLKRLPILFLPDEKDRELLLNLVILEPAWLIGVMKIIMELSRTSQGDRRLIIELDDTGIASESLLREKWANFYTESESGPSFHQLCLILQAYCLIFPLKGFQSPSEPALPSADGQTSTSFLVPSKMPEIATEDEIDSDVPWVVFYFDFEKFLPEVIYHRLICIMLACADDYTSEEVMPKFSKSWSCFYDIEESHWKFEYQQTLHRLQVSIQTEDRQKRSSHFFKIHDHLRQICDQSHLQGLKYYGGPEARCKCKGPNSEQISRILRFAEYHGEKRICERKMSSKCKKCFKEFNLDDILDLQVPEEETQLRNSENDSVQDSNSEPVEKDGAASTTSDNRNGAGALSGKVTLPQLVVLKPRSGEKLRIIDSAKHKWKEITSLICSDTNKISTLEKQDSGDCLRQVLINCFLENRPQNYSQDWNGLIELLDDVGLQVLAEDVKKYILETECMHA